MAIKLNAKETLIDYFETVLLWQAVTERELAFVALNKTEWVQLIALLKSNYKDCAANCSIREDGNTATYKTLELYYDGSNDEKLKYIGDLYELQEMLEDNRQRNAAEHQGVGAAENPILATMPVNPPPLRQTAGFTNVAAAPRVAVRPAGPGEWLFHNTDEA